MYDYLLDVADPDTVQPSAVITAEVERSHPGLYMTDYQKQRQRAYDRARHMVRNLNHHHPDVEDAKAEAGLVSGEAHISRARGDQLKWLKSMLRNNSATRYGYRTPVDLVVSRIDVHRPTARDLVYLAQRLGVC